MEKKEKASKAAKSQKETTTIEFLKPSGSSTISCSQEDGIFPPTVFSDAIYSKGIRVFPDSAKETNDVVSLSYDYDYAAPLTDAVKSRLSIDTFQRYQYNGDTVPLLSPTETRLWNHKRAAKSAAQLHFPMNVFRLLGTITREVTVTDDSPNGPFTKLSRYSPRCTSFGGKEVDRQYRMTIQQATTEARTEQGPDGDDYLKARATEIQTQWNEKVDQGPRRTGGWDKNGQLSRYAVNDDEFIPLPLVRDWLKQQDVMDPSPSHTSLYNGLRSIPNNLEEILTSLLELTSPKGLYKIPLVLPVAFMEVVEETRTAKKVEKRASKKQKAESIQRTWKIRIGVYANRLLPEIMTSHDLHIVMTALDDGSFRVTEPLHLPPLPTEPVFASAPTPIVVTDEESNNEEMSDSDNEEKKSDDVDVVDLTIGESTRDESRVSAFSVKGFLKLLESSGNDTSNWPSIEPRIASFLKLELMLHQQHAICWMLQMESLSGFGINSILWEEREFLDGGRYYYSPALGQMRLEPPPVMKGGILADEQGLGKTLEVLGLIIASLDELKRGAAEAAKDCCEDDLLPTHATLIIVPPALVSQWRSEIRKAVGDALEVQYFNPKSLIFESDTEEEKDPDVVITTYAALQTNSSSKTLFSFSWGRVVLDEMQEIRSSTTKIAKNCDNLYCQRRWMVSGTPLFDGIDDLRGELNFLQLEPYAARLEDGFFDFSIMNHWRQHSIHGLDTLKILGMLMLRRSKSMTISETGQPLLGLKPLTVEFVPIPQSLSERAVYCFLESVISRVLNGGSSVKGAACRATCLRILREGCISPIILSGGMGVPPQLSILHGWMVQENRRNLSVRASREGISSTHGQRSYPFSCHASMFSCDEAIQYLSSAHEGANVGEDMVSDLTVGFGGGASNRNRAANDLEAELTDAEKTLKSDAKALADAKSERARARWHLALEKITTGHMDFDARLDSSFVFLWKLRYTAIAYQLSINENIECVEDMIRAEVLSSSKSKMPLFLRRGWRPSSTFMSNLFENHPEFAWAHPWSFQLDDVPSSILSDEIKSSILMSWESAYELGTELSDDCRINVVSSSSAEEKWTAVVQFSDEDDYKSFRTKASSKNGIALSSKSVLPQVQSAIEMTKSILDGAEAEYKVLPVTTSQAKLSAAKKEHKRALLGLRIVLKSDGFPCHLRACRALGSCRSSKPLLYEELCSAKANSVAESNILISQKAIALDVAGKKIAKLRNIGTRQVPDDVQALSVFETLNALSNGETEKTKCPICLCNLGVKPDEQGEEIPALVAMSHCGHIFCADCLKEYAEKRHVHHICCPSCRRAIDMTRPVIIIDTEKTEDRDKLEERRQAAKSLVQRVEKLLDESNGQLDSQIWQELYLSIDLPPNADRSRHPRYNAIPGDLLGHLRTATGMVSAGTRQDQLPLTNGRNVGLSSKVRALLADLPRAERSVVFSESKSAVKHLMFVLEKAGIGCRALFSGEAISAAEVALEDWKSTMSDAFGNEFIPFPVLIIQAGAAASGLTLTAACKMFIMEPFSRMEEEQQAYARCHRYGQEHPCHVKCYFAPVSVESRLLEWRKRASERPTGNASDTKVVYATVATDEMEAEEQISVVDDTEAEQTRTNFLLGLTGDEQGALASSEMELD